MKMLKFELKKVFSKSMNKIAILLLIVITVITGIMTIDRVEYVDTNGDHSVGFAAAEKLREAKNEWAGYLTDDVLQKVIEENQRINNSEETQTDDIAAQEQVYSEKQGISGILDVISSAWSDYRDYDYFAADSVSAGEVSTIYEKRISTLKNWLDSGEENYTQAEKDFLLQQYENLYTPFYYEYMDAWPALLQNIPTFLLMLALVICFLVSGIFSDEFQTKADSIFFSSRLGRNRAVASKAGAGFLITSVFYVSFVLLYTMIVLLVLGAGGANCPIQLDMWRSVYNITFFQAYLFIVAGGYIGTLLASTLTMLTSALSRSTATAVIVPFVVLCVFPFLSRIITLPGFCSFFPDQLLNIYNDLKESALVEIGGKVMTTAAVIIPVYAIISLILQPVLYHVYRRTEIR